MVAQVLMALASGVVVVVVAQQQPGRRALGRQAVLEATATSGSTATATARVAAAGRTLAARLALAVQAGAAQAGSLRPTQPTRRGTAMAVVVAGTTSVHRAAVAARAS
jgi:hypothetical protein